MATPRKKAGRSAASVRPRGRDEVSTAVLDGARVLFASRPYKDVTMREIADRARVNLGLLHRHFGTKELILQAVIQNYATHYRTVATKSPSVPEALLALFSDASQAPFLRTLAHLILADLPTHDFIARDGALAVMLGGGPARSRARKAQADDMRVNVLVAFALFMGWSLFEQFLIDASGKKVSHDRFRKEVFRLGNELLSPGTPIASTPAKPARARPRKATR
jgi:TetR/AcrR family transcriptional regulator, repressor for neighboring sulfatase